MGFQFAGKAVYTAVWVAAASLFMELLGFSTQKYLTAGGLGTVLITLAGREVWFRCLFFSRVYPFSSCNFFTWSRDLGRFTHILNMILCFLCTSFELFLLLLCSDLHQLSFKCNDSCDTAICCEWMDSDKDWRLWSFWYCRGWYFGSPQLLPLYSTSSRWRRAEGENRERERERIFLVWEPFMYGLWSVVDAPWIFPTLIYEIVFFGKREYSQNFLAFLLADFSIFLLYVFMFLHVAACSAVVTNSCNGWRLGNCSHSKPRVYCQCCQKFK